MKRRIKMSLVTLMTFNVGLLSYYIFVNQKPVEQGIKAVSFVVNNDLKYPKKTNDSILQTQKHLWDIKYDDCTKVPQPAKPLLKLLKHQLVDLIEKTLNEQRTRNKDPKLIKAHILGKLEKDGVEVTKSNENSGSSYDEHDYGHIYNIDVNIPKNHPELITFTTTIGIACGEDTSLYLFKYDGKEWRLILAQAANDYDEVSGGQGDFGYEISPRDERGNYFVVTANITPWCTSRWHTLRYSIMRIGSSPYSPKVILQEETEIMLDDDPQYIFNVWKDGFVLRFRNRAYMSRLQKIVDKGLYVSADDSNNFSFVRYRIKDDKMIQVY